jgi:hypothetical protein
MAITIFNDGDITVSTIMDRNQIVNRFEGMQVTVNDATGDATLGGGRACYQWDSSNSTWALVWSDYYSTMQFSTEVKTIVDGQVTADNVPADGKVWQCRVIDQATGVIVGDARPTVNLGVLDLGTLDHDGKELEFTYAYGSISSQLQVVFDSIQTQFDNLGLVGQKVSDSDKLDGLDSTKFLRIDANGTIGGKLTLAKADPELVFSDTSDAPLIHTSRIRYEVIDANTPNNASGAFQFEDISTGRPLSLVTTGEIYAKSNKKVWHSGNDGSGSGLDADMLDGIHITALTRHNVPVTLTGDVTGSAVVSNDGSISMVTTVADDSHNHVISNVDGLQTALDSKLSNAGGELTGDLLPATDGLNIGSSTQRWSAIFVDEAYLSTNTLYIGDTPVMGTDADTIIIKADPDQSIAVNTYGLGTTSVTSQREVIVSTSGVNADVKVQATGTNSKVRFSGDGGIELSDATTVQDNLNVTGNLTVSGNITANGSQFIVNATTVTTKDNIITVNSGEVGSGVTAGKAGIQVDRGDAADYQLVFDETTDKFVVGQVGGTMETLATREHIQSLIGTEIQAYDASFISDANYVHTDNNYTTEEKTKLAGIEANAQVNTVTSVAGKTGVITLDKADVGLANVDNTSDINKVVASAGKLTTPITISLDGNVVGSVLFDGSTNVIINTTINGGTF